MIDVHAGVRALLGTICLAAASPGAPAAAGAPHAGHAEINGIRVYHELHNCPAAGAPLVLLHGGGSTIDVTFGKILPFLARGRCVIAIEEQAHGRTSDRDAPVRFETSADDVAALLKHLRHSRADIFGFSNGASTALQVAIRHPRLVRKLVFASAMTKKEGAPAQLWEFIGSATFEQMPQPLKDAFLAVNPDPAKLRSMHDKDLDRMRRFRDVPDADLRRIEAEVLVMIGDRDVVKPEHAVEISRLIPRARLLILPAGHGEYLGEAVVAPNVSHYPELTAGLIAEFLGAP